MGFTWLQPTSRAVQDEDRQVAKERFEAAEAEDLVDTLREKSQAETKSKLLILPHDSASHEAVVLAIDSSAQAGITEISIADIHAAPDP